MLKTASEVRSHLRFEISDLDYLHIHVHVAYMVWAFFDSLGGHYSLKTASEVKSDLRFEISDLDYLHIRVHIAYMVWALLTATEATTASKPPQRSNPTSDLKSVTSITYICMRILLMWIEHFLTNKCALKLRLHM